ncbi:MAG: ABC transporter ATP-binding protein [Opitutales bacterium]
MSTQGLSEVLSVRGLERWLGDGANRTHALRGLDFDLVGGKVYSVVGPSGCGKSTLLYLLGLLDRPDGGEIHLGGVRVDSASDRERTRLRGSHLGFVFQFHFLLAEFTAQENIMLPMVKQGLDPSEARRRADTLLDEVGLAGRAHNRGNQLSGGEQQRIAVARALANRPRLLLADEPTGNLDQQNSEALFGLLQRVAHDWGHTVLLVTHNRELARRCDHTLAMRDGRFSHGEGSGPTGPVGAR